MFDDMLSTAQIHAGIITGKFYTTGEVKMQIGKLGSLV
jgi:hypothetical protein